MAEGNINITVTTQDKGLQDLITKLNAGTITVKEYNAEVRQMRNAAIVGSQAQMDLKNVVAQVGDATLTANGKMMKSYFTLGEELRRFYKEQRLGDRVMRDASSTMQVFGGALGLGGLTPIVNMTINSFQQMEFVTNSIGLTAVSSGGKFKEFGEKILGVAGPAAAVAAAIMGIAYAAQEAEKITQRFVKALDDLYAANAAGNRISTEEQVRILTKQINELQQKPLDSPSVWAQVLGPMKIAEERAAMAVEREKQIVELQNKRAQLEEKIASDSEKNAGKSEKNNEQAQQAAKDAQDRLKSLQIEGIDDKFDREIAAINQKYEAEKAKYKKFADTVKALEEARLNDIAKIEDQRYTKRLQNEEAASQQRIAIARKEAETKRTIDALTGVFDPTKTAAQKTPARLDTTAFSAPRQMGKVDVAANPYGAVTDLNKGVALSFEEMVSHSQAFQRAFSRMVNTISSEISGKIGGAFAQVFGGAKTMLGQLASDTASTLTDALIRLGLSQIPYIGPFLAAARADGGPAIAGRPYIVGERGPELFIPNRSGEVVSNAKASRFGSMAMAGGPIVLETRIRGNDLVLVQAKSSLTRKGRLM